VTTSMTRRELRELEKAATPAVASSPIENQAQNNAEVRTQIQPKTTEPTHQIQPDGVQLSRRQMREQGLLGGTASKNEATSSPDAVEVNRSQETPLSLGSSTSRRALRDSAEPETQTSSAEPVPEVAQLGSIEPPEELIFTGTNLLAEPSTQSIVLDATTEAISLPMDTGEIFTTGSISIVSDPATGSQTAGFDLDALTHNNDSVLGVVSVVDPISAMDLIDRRATVGVVPQSVLRRGWWKSWAVALSALVLSIAAILASITILGAIGG